MNKTQTIVLANQKGGCGKTTTAVQLATGLALEGYRTCLVDIDGQCNASMALGLDPEQLKRDTQPTVLDVYLKKRPAAQIAVPVRADAFEGRLLAVPGYTAMAAVHPSLEADLKRESLTDGLSPEDEDDRRVDHRDRLRKSLESLHDDCDFIIIDTPPDLGFLLSTALRAGDWFIIPVLPAEFELKGMQRLIETAKKVRARSNPELRLLRILVGAYDKSTVLDAEIYSKLKRQFGAHLSPVKVTRGVRLRESFSYHVSIYEHAPESDQAKQFRAFVREVAEAVREPSTRHEVASEEHPSDVLVPQAPPARVAEEGMVREAANE